jgi:ABC-type antimicrobial peptide transport system permease subunit
VLEAALAALGDTNIKTSYSYKDSPVYDKIKQNLDTIETMATFMPMVYFAVAMIVVFLFMTLVIRQSRREIGILRALGFIASAVIIGFAVIIGLTIVYNTAQTNLLEKKKELCILRTLGFPHGEISANWFVQSLIQYAAAVAVGMPLGIKLAKTALIRLSNEKMSSRTPTASRNIS